MFGVLGNYEVGARHRWQQDTIYNYLQLSPNIYNYLQLSLHLRRFLAFHHIPITPQSPNPATISCRSPATSQTRENIRNIFLPFVFWEKMKMHFCQLHSYSLDKKRSRAHQSQFVEISTIYFYLFWWMKHFVEQCFWLIFSSIMDIWNVM